MTHARRFNRRIVNDMRTTTGAGFRRDEQEAEEE